MAYTLMAESKGPVDWAALHGAVMPLRKRVEVFPIPASNGLGISVPQRLRNDMAWEEIVQLADLLRSRFGMEFCDLQTGDPVNADTMEALRQRFLVE
jgi:hypothetical protein